MLTVARRRELSRQFELLARASSLKSEIPKSKSSPDVLVTMSSEKVTWVNRIDDKWLDANIRRGGAVPYTVIDGTVMLCLGTDLQSGDLTDFGGSFAPKFDLSPKKCVVRELEEESLGVFKFLVTDILNCPCVHNHNMLIVFIRVQPNRIETSMSNFADEFASRSATSERLEVSEINWMSLSLFRTKIQSGKVFSRVAELLTPTLSQINMMLLGAEPRDN